MEVYKILNIRNKLRLNRLIRDGLTVGDHCYIDPKAFIDGVFPWMISIGNNCRITVNVTILAHDSSTAALLGVTKVGSVSIGNNCFIGAGSIILPNVHIGNNVIIGAGSVVTHDIPDNSVAVGTPAKVITSTANFSAPHVARINKGYYFPKKGYMTGSEVTDGNRKEMREKVKDAIYYVKVK